MSHMFTWFVTRNFSCLPYPAMFQSGINAVGLTRYLGSNSSNLAWAWTKNILHYMLFYHFWWDFGKWLTKTSLKPEIKEQNVHSTKSDLLCVLFLDPTFLVLNRPRLFCREQTFDQRKSDRRQTLRRDQLAKSVRKEWHSETYDNHFCKVDINQWCMTVFGVKTIMNPNYTIA